MKARRKCIRKDWSQVERIVGSFMHVPAFPRLELLWRDLHYLVRETETSTMLKIRVLNASKEDLRRDLERFRAFPKPHWHQGCLDVTWQMPPSEICPGSI
jgi:predicted component of type VI protein secretion system